MTRLGKQSHLVRGKTVGARGHSHHGADAGVGVGRVQRAAPSVYTPRSQQTRNHRHFVVPTSTSTYKRCHWGARCAWQTPTQDSRYRASPSGAWHCDERGHHIAESPPLLEISSSSGILLPGFPLSSLLCDINRRGLDRSHVEWIMLHFIAVDRLLHDGFQLFW